MLLDDLIALAAERECPLVLSRAHGVFTAQAGLTVAVGFTLVEALQLLHRELARPAVSPRPRELPAPAARRGLRVVRGGEG